MPWMTNPITSLYFESWQSNACTARYSAMSALLDELVLDMVLKLLAFNGGYEGGRFLLRADYIILYA